ncbi:MAG TPA: dihydroorotase [Gammaproteobacteria bacterium]|nr:dihydroorotase [Gammaproteobacteria bacterium]
MRLLIRNGRLINPGTEFDGVADVCVENGKIIALGDVPAGFRGDEEIDAGGQYVFPGIIDLCARLREPGFEYKATIASETAAAASAGITTLCCPPDTIPVIDNPSVVEMIRYRAQQSNKASVLSIGALTPGLEGTQLSEMAALKEIGAVAVSNALKPVKNTLVMRRAMEYAHSLGLTVFLFAEDPWLNGAGCAHEGVVSTRLGLDGIPEIAETIAVARDLALIEQIGVRAHFCHLSTAKAVSMIARAQHEGLPVSADVSAHQLHLTDMELGEFNALYHVRPPLRAIRDRDGLRSGLQRGNIRIICSDHQPHEVDAKIGPFSTTAPGISALETLLPLTMRLVDDGTLTLNQALACLTSEPAKILGLDLGSLVVGARADICIYDPDKVWTFNENTIQSEGLNSPFLGWEFEGRVTHTIYDGNVVYRLSTQESFNVSTY